jgi:hypothetical protein
MGGIRSRSLASRESLPDGRRGAAAISRIILLAAALLSPALLSPFAGGGGAVAAEANLAGNCNGDGTVDLADAIFLLDFLFQGSVKPSCMPRCDYQQNGSIDISDAILLLQNVVGVAAQPPKPLVLPLEICGDGIDNNCDGRIDEDCSTQYSIDLAWDAVTKDVNGNARNVAGYRIFSGTSASSYITRSEVAGCACATLSGLQFGVTYYVAVSAFDGSGNESALSGEIQIRR